ncbi:Uncharacterised protein [Klebsiella pneumoniae]|nr:Uncharacterised protein [Klebsiella pneumoniae]
MHFIQVAVGTGHHRHLVADTLGGQVKVSVVENIGERIKLQRVAVEIYAAHVFTQGLVAVAHVEHPGKPAGVEHATNEGLNQTGFARPGGAADRHVEIGIVHSLVEQVDERQLVTVGGRQESCRRQRTVSDNRQKVGHLERLRPLHHTCRLQLFEQAFAAFERHHGQKITQVMIAGRDKLEATLTVTVEHLLLGSERGLCVIGGIRGDVKEVGHQRGLVGRQSLADIAPLLHFLYHVRKVLRVGGFAFLLHVHEFQVGFVLGLHLVLHHQRQCDDKGAGDGELRVQQVGVVVRSGPEKGDFRVTLQVIVRHPGHALFPVPPQAANFQMTGSDLHVKAVIHALIVQVLIRVQLVRHPVHLMRIRVNQLPHQFDHPGRIEDTRRDVSPAERCP